MLCHVVVPRRQMGLIYFAHFIRRWYPYISNATDNEVIIDAICNLKYAELNFDNKSDEIPDRRNDSIFDISGDEPTSIKSETDNKMTRETDTEKCDETNTLCKNNRKTTRVERTYGVEDFMGLVSSKPTLSVDEFLNSVDEINLQHDKINIQDEPQDTGMMGTGSDTYINDAFVCDILFGETKYIVNFFQETHADSTKPVETNEDTVNNSISKIIFQNHCNNKLIQHFDNNFINHIDSSHFEPSL